MEQIKQLTQQTVGRLHQSNSLPQLQTDSQGLNTIKRSEKGELSISLYFDNFAEKSDIAVGIAKLCASFPRMEQSFWSLLAERIVENNFSKERIKEAVDYILDNFKYKELNIADIISFDRKVKLYTCSEFMQAQMNGIHPSKFEMREINDVKFWVLKEDLIKANLNK